MSLRLFATLTSITVMLVWPAASHATTSRDTLYRLYNSQTANHLYTTSVTERDAAANNGYTAEGSVGYVESAAGTGLAPLYRLYSSARNEHFYTSDVTERDSLTHNGFTAEGITGYLAQTNQTGTSAMYRLYLRASSGLHFYTTNAAERDSLVNRGEANEGIVGYVFTVASAPPPPPPTTSDTMEVESMSLTSGAGQTYTDSSASGGKAVLVWSNGTATGTITTPSAGRLTIRAMGDQCNGAPEMDVTLDGTQVMTAGVAATSWTDYGVNTTVSAGSHNIKITYPNDYMGGGCDRNLRLDKVSFGAAVVEQAPPPAPPPPPPSSSGQWNTYKGFNFQAWNRDQYGTDAAATSLNNMASTGANAITVNTIWYENSGNDNSMFQDQNLTASDVSMVTTIQRAKAKDLRVMIRPMINTYGNSTWRGSFQPSSTSTWFANYRVMMNHYADMAAAQGADLLDIGSEYNSLQGNDAEWRHVVSDVRAHYHGLVTYSGNWDTYPDVRWYDAVDMIGIDAYFPLAYGGEKLTEDQVVARWTSNPDSWGSRNTHIISDITALQAKFNKPLIFTEIGYRSGSDPLDRPWDTGGSYDPTDQQIALNAAFRAFDGKPWFKGMFIWQWNADPNAGGAGDTDHTPQRKPAQNTVTTRYAST